MANYNLREVLKRLGRNILSWVKSNCVNNCVSTTTNLPLAAAQGKVLQDQITALNSNIGNKQDVLNIGKFTGNINILSASGSNLPPRSSVCWCNKAELDSKSIVPSGVNYFFLETWVSSVNLQRLTSYTDMKIYSRFYVNGSWTNWA